MLNEFDVIVVGGGHAGCEAAAAAANLGSKVLLISIDLTKLAQMSCNPAMGGVAKGQIVREIDALGGLSAIITDLSTIQFRMLNKSKGPAMWSPRAQCDRMIFSQKWREELEKIPNLFLLQDSVTDLLVDNKTIIGVVTQLELKIKAKSVILTNGTFLTGVMYVGEVRFPGGRIGEVASYGLTEKLKSLGFQTGRMKTGTPVRIDKRTVNLNKLVEQKQDDEVKFFSYLTKEPNTLQKQSCYIAHTSTIVHDTLKVGFQKSPLFKGEIQGIGPRYCPSIEDKLRTFADKEQHQLFLEPEGESTYEMYLNGFSSSLPSDIQYKALKKIQGFEDVHILRPGYAIEYDYFPPTQLFHTLETKQIKNLYFAGQINGTTGYEEAAAQGLIAGINASNAILKKEKFILSREEAYIGVLIDDLVTKGVDEPYRMFTSRAEHRILLRQDNADERLTPIGYKLGLASSERMDILEKKLKDIKTLISFIKNHSVNPDEINGYLIEIKSTPITQKRKLIDIILRPEVNLIQLASKYHKLTKIVNSIESFTVDVIESVDIQIKYGGYIARERLVADKLHRLDHININTNFDYNTLNSISTEAKQKLSRIKPTTIGQARRIPGVSPSDINVLLVYLGR
ncbi:MAG TPA: tRNA uridine-5-carboxymethylaminomethyl(34) synthesis enzyme MnmG [Tenuifilaceae bacterium]|nr:tRNA uridine-5-carboxymethylaminomethyl(34) synthesis enzyme MnmG [Tenuifilaceae bacterium]HPJ44846.1 tRNA uridine-5-carboxymethylaminomethyl(34) synthesis enzyme MnmG [Tenuifilaceae bacterium]HPQ32860.1 tRNA uridine-5-carboxymethylaminomethyl(34) synthesis enzyme MnmG [Tenuifilaceae bacterium]HRX67211.1 tRNA uridine-5-carboxymethylaminomethyl(34) synthesis enzyme MnmG [Tenuifilaceae bacterium]